MEAPTNEIVTLSHSRETLRRVKENDESFKTLWIGGTVRKSTRNNQPTIIVHTQNTKKDFKRSCWHMQPD